MTLSLSGSDIASLFHVVFLRMAHVFINFYCKIYFTTICLEFSFTFFSYGLGFSDFNGNTCKNFIVGAGDC